MLTSDQIGGIVRALATTGAGIAVTKGWIDNNTAVWLAGGAATLAVGAWSWWTNRPAKLTAPAPLPSVTIPPASKP